MRVPKLGIRKNTVPSVPTMLPSVEVAVTAPDGELGFLIDAMGSKVLIVSSALSLAALAALFFLNTRSASPES